MSAKDRYVSMDEGRLVMNEENDGWTFMTKGSERSEEHVTLKSLEGTGFHKSAISNLKASIPKKHRLIKIETKEYDVINHLKPQELEQYAEYSWKLENLRGKAKDRIAKKNKSK
jgi:hypothetical protein